MILRTHYIHEVKPLTFATFFDTENEYEEFKMSLKDKIILIYKIVTDSKIVGIVTHKKINT
ncbi:MAG: hypothetical protein WC917_04605 [Bacilli bacterium]|jgi:hypothetical protein